MELITLVLIKFQLQECISEDMNNPNVNLFLTEGYHMKQSDLVLTAFFYKYPLLQVLQVVFFHPKPQSSWYSDHELMYLAHSCGFFNQNDQFGPDFIKLTAGPCM